MPNIILNNSVENTTPANNTPQNAEAPAISYDHYLATILENSYDAIVGTDINHIIKSWNKAAEKLFGYSLSEVLQKPIDQFINIDPEKRKELRDGLIKDGKWNGEIEVIKKDNTLLKAIFSINTIKDTNGNITDHIGSVKDNTELFNLREDLKTKNILLQKEIEEKNIFTNEILDRISDGFAAFDKDLNFRYVNSFFEKLLNRTSSQLIGCNAKKEFSHLKSVDILERAFIAQNDTRIEYYSEPYKRWFIVHLFPSPNGITAYVRDITKRKIADDETKKSNRLYEFISKVNDLALHTKDINKIYSEFCKIAVDSGNFLFAWIGLENLITKTIYPVCWAGHEDGYLKNIHISTENIPTGEGPTGKAFRENKYYYCNNIETDSAMTIWRENALKRGYHSSIAIPISSGNKVISVITLYAPKVNFFTDSEIQMLVRATNNISYTLNAISIDNKRKDIEKQLQKVNTALEHTSASIVITDLKGNIEYINKAFTDLTGYSFKEAFGKNPKILKSGITPQSVYHHVWQNLTHGKEWRGEFCNKKKNGELYWEYAIISPIINETGDITNYMAVKENITDRKKIEEEKNKLIQIIEHTNAYTGIMDIVDRKPIFINSSFKKILELDEEQSNDFSKIDFKIQDATYFEKEILPIILEKGYWNGVITFYSKSQKNIQVLANLILHKDDKGKPNQVSITALDITELKEKQLELSKLAGIIENTKALVCICDLNYKISFLNESAKERLGIGQDEDISLLYATEFIPFSVIEIMDRIENTFFTEGKWVGESKLKNRNGEIFPTLEVVLLHKNDRGEAEFLSFTSLDITQQKNAEIELQKLTGELRELSVHLQNAAEQERASIAKEIHDELAQNLVALSMNANWLKNSIKDGNKKINDIIDEQIGIADNVIKSSRTLFNSLHPSMLDELGLEAATKWYAKTKLKLTDTQFEYHTNVNISDTQITKEMNLGLFRIFQESLTNVLRYSKATNLSVHVIKDETNVKLIIQDNGVGFDMNTIDPFNSHGLLGMRERAYAMSGKFEINSVIGKGTTIKVEVPLN